MRLLLSCVLQLLNKQHLATALDIAHMRDGLVMFESAEDADRFASKLEEEGHSQASGTTWTQLHCSSRIQASNATAAVMSG